MFFNEAFDTKSNYQSRHFRHKRSKSFPFSVFFLKKLLDNVLYGNGCVNQDKGRHKGQEMRTPAQKRNRRDSE